MPRTAQLTARGFGRGWRDYRRFGWGEMVANATRRLCGGLGAIAVLASFLLLLALLTYNPGDASFDTAGGAAPHNFLGHDGALIADALFQSVGLAAYLLPAVLLGWAFRLMLRRPIEHVGRALAMLLAALVLGAAACSILQPDLDRLAALKLGPTRRPRVRRSPRGDDGGGAGRATAAVDHRLVAWGLARARPR